MRIELKKIKTSNIDEIVKLINDSKDIAKNTARIPYPYKKSDATTWIKFVQSQRRKKKPTDFTFGIFVDGKFAGSISLHRINYKYDNAVVGYWLGKEFRGKGVVTKAIRMLIKKAFVDMKLKRLALETYVFNKASANVAKRAGFQKEGILRKSHKKNGKYLDSIIWSRIRR